MPPGEGVADLPLLAVLRDPETQVADEFPRLLQFHGELKPFARNEGLLPLQGQDHASRLPLGETLPVLVAGDFWFVAVGQEGRRPQGVSDEDGGGPLPAGGLAGTAGGIPAIRPGRFLAAGVRPTHATRAGLIQSARQGGQSFPDVNGDGIDDRLQDPNFLAQKATQVQQQQPGLLGQLLGGLGGGALPRRHRLRSRRPRREAWAAWVA